MWFQKKCVVPARIFFFFSKSAWYLVRFLEFWFKILIFSRPFFVQNPNIQQAFFLFKIPIFTRREVPPASLARSVLKPCAPNPCEMRSAPKGSGEREVGRAGGRSVGHSLPPLRGGCQERGVAVRWTRLRCTRLKHRTCKTSRRHLALHGLGAHGFTQNVQD